LGSKIHYRLSTQYGCNVLPQQTASKWIKMLQNGRKCHWQTSKAVLWQWWMTHSNINIVERQFSAAGRWLDDSANNLQTEEHCLLGCCAV
jgi:hypothetical protein